MARWWIIQKKRTFITCCPCYKCPFNSSLSGFPCPSHSTSRFALLRDLTNQQYTNHCLTFLKLETKSKHCRYDGHTSQHTRFLHQIPHSSTIGVYFHEGREWNLQCQILFCQMLHIKIKLSSLVPEMCFKTYLEWSRPCECLSVSLTVNDVALDK